MTRSKYAKQLTKKDVIENIIANDYIYFQDGSMAQTISYVGAHPRAGESIFTFKGSEYNLKVN